MYKTVLEIHNIQSRSDYEYLKNVNSETAQKSAPLKEKFERCKQLCELYLEIAKTYHIISRGDFISKLVEEQRKVDESVRNRKHWR